MTATRRTTQDDKPFEFNLDTVAAEVDLAPFRFQWGGKRWEMAHTESLDVWDLIESADKGELVAMVAVMTAAFGARKWGEFQKIKLPTHKLKALFEAYQKHCGLEEPGESQGSTSS